MNVQQWESMSEQERHEWARFREWQHAQSQVAQSRVAQSRVAQSRVAQTPIPQPRAPWAAAAAMPGHVQLGSRTSRRVLTAAAVAVVLALATGLLLALAGTSTRSITGAMTVMNGTSSLYSSSSYGSCHLSSGYDDIVAGTAVTVRDSAGRIAGVGALDSGTGSSYGCTFSFVVDDVPASDFYTVEVGHRGEVTFTDAAVRNGDIQLSLG
ncbi:hypothetical protein FVA95_08600 [Pseudonocardia sp. EV170527-09]|uniref:hypothetical protein n=1 Tax=Pseudonocardia sp. EV170527-09 TaxID=2603411 RepID=UPI0011F171CC|nr:hypothetical protein [Pseudonocardia sp. EV170527-09]KAA1031813.1 hypothetical protein FVA95_08600 [Pseudonocardia sp. EV170527-09]